MYSVSVRFYSCYHLELFYIKNVHYQKIKKTLLFISPHKQSPRGVLINGVCKRVICKYNRALWFNQVTKLDETTDQNELTLSSQKKDEKVNEKEMKTFKLQKVDRLSWLDI